MAAELIQTDLKRRLLLPCAVHQRGNSSDLGVHAGAGNQNGTAPRRHQRAGKYHIVLFCQRYLFCPDLPCLLFHIDGFSRQGTLVH